MKKKLLIFDFDGTIADTLMVAEEILNETGEEFGLPKMTRPQMMELKHKSIAELLKISGVSWIQVPRLVHKLRNRFQNHISKVEPIRGMPELLFTLQHQGYRMGILSSNTQEGIAHFLQRHQLPPFEFILTPKSIFGKSKALKSALKRINMAGRDALMIGDELRDIEAANKAGVEAIGVTWGFNSSELLLHGAPLHIISVPAQLLEVLEQ
jgi:HAD superfamily hydrolase (TIGR01549 family)